MNSFVCERALHAPTAAPAPPKQSVLAVVGGGAVGTSFICQLARSLEPSDSASVEALWVFEPDPQPGAGDAYQDDVASNLLNTRAAGISVVHDHPNHFYRWAVRHEASWRARFPALVLKADQHWPRALFGRYLQAVFETSVAALRRAGVRVVHVPSTVVSATAIDPHGNQLELRAADGTCCIADAVVFAVGNQGSTRFDHLRHHVGYFATPYPCSELVSQVDSDASVVVLGSSLSAVDVAIALADAGHRGPIAMVSRHGQLPSARSDARGAPATRPLSRASVGSMARAHGGLLRLHDLAEVLMHDLVAAPDAAASLTPPTNRPVHAASARTRLAVETARDRVWRVLVDRLGDSVDLIWHHLTTADRRIVERDFKHLWLHYRVSMPPANAAKVQALLDARQLMVHKGEVEALFDPLSARFEVEFVDPQHGAEALSLRSQALVNATGHATQLRRCRSALVRDMLARGLAREHEFGGLDVDFATSRILTREGLRLGGAYALGGLASGTYFWTHAMSVNARLAAGVVQHVLARARGAGEHIANTLDPRHPVPSRTATALALDPA
jgi:uncharacterized NAD(P)/FAD-binding protein YdhS